MTYRCHEDRLKIRSHVESLESRLLLAANPNPGVIPPNAHAFRTTYADLGGDWWNHAGQFGFEDNPINANGAIDCSRGQDGKVWFLHGTFGGTAERSCSIPTGKALFLPLANSVWWADADETEAELRALANADIDPIDPASDIEASIDGRELRGLANYRAESPTGGFVLQADPLLVDFGLEPGDRDPAVTDGYWLLIAPLSAGEHTIQFHADLGGGFEVGATYTLTVEKSGRGKSLRAGLEDIDSQAQHGTGEISTGDFTVALQGSPNVEEEMRTQDAIDSLNESLEHQGVTLTMAAPGEEANINIEFASDSACGGLAEGVLGCATDDGQVTIIQDWNWYTRNDASQITSTQYDLQTVLTHELAHAIGLDHSDAADSALFPSLDSGEVHRSIAGQDYLAAGHDSEPTTGAIDNFLAPEVNFDFLSEQTNEDDDALDTLTELALASF